MNCKRCEVACPSNVRIGDIIQSARIKYGPKKNTSLRNYVLANTDLVGSLATPFAPIVNTAVTLKPVRYMMDKVMSIDHRRIFPKYAHGTFTSWYKKHAAASQSAYPKQVAFFHGCYVNYNNPQLGKDLIRIMNSLGYGVNLLDKEKCCGVPLISNGLYKQAERQAKTNLSSIRLAVNDHDMDVITTSSTCTFTLRDEYPHILNLKNEDVRDRIELATRYLYKLIQSGEVQLKFKEGMPPLRIAYHTPCHMEKMGWGYYSIELLRMIPGIEVIVLDSQCCGIAGTYGFKKENYPTSQSVGEPLFRQIEASGANLVASDCETCKWQIEMSTTKACEHPLTILASRLA